LSSESGAEETADSVGAIHLYDNFGVQIGSNNVQNLAYHVTLPTAQVVWPVRVGVPVQLAGHYQDRTARSQLTEALAVGETAVLVGVESHSGAVVSGLGGVGKSQLAAHYAWQVWRDESVDVAVWVDARSRDAVVTAYAEAARRVLYEQDPQVAERTPEDAASLFREWLASTSRRWLAVLDDLRDPADLRGLWPSPSPTGRVLVTTRRRDNVLSQGGRRVIELGVFSESEALDYLTAILPSRVAEEAGIALLRDMAMDLGWLPLALAQAGAFIADKPLLTVAQYRQRLVDRRRALTEVMPTEAELPDEHQATVAATWSLSIELADSLQPTGLVLPLLHVASLLDPAGTPITVFTSTSILKHLSRVTDHETDDQAVHDAFACLHRLSLITLDPDQPARSVQIHTLVQRVVRDTLTTEPLQQVTEVAARALLETWPEIDTAKPDLAQALRSATDALHTYAAEALWAPGARRLLLRAGRSLGDTGQVTAAIAYHEALRDQAHVYLGPEDEGTFVVRHNLARWRSEAGDVTRAVAETEQLLEDMQRTLGSDRLETFPIRQNLAQLRGMSGDVTGAITDCEQLVTEFQNKLGTSHSRVFAVRGNLAQWRGRFGDYTRAVADLQQLLADMQQALGSDHPDTLTTRNNLSFARGESGDAEGAVVEFEQLLVDRTRVLGPTHPQTLATRSNIARMRNDTEDPKRAITEFEELLADMLRVLGPDHPETLITRSNLARGRGLTGDLTRAVAESEELLTDMLRVLGPDHPETLITRSNLARWRSDSGDLMNAFSEFKRLVNDRLRVLGPDHPETFIARGHVARVQAMAGNFVRAKKGYEQLLDDMRLALGEDHPETLLAWANLAYLRGATEGTTHAVNELQQVLTEARRVLGTDHPTTRTIRASLTNWKKET
jgi:NB-ARC domain-containing protein/tetratricopeptide repeat protein